MRIKKGIPVSPGIAQAPAFLIDTEEFAISRQRVAKSAIPAQIDRFKEAKEKASEEIRALIEVVEKEVGSEGVAILQMHLVLLADPDFRADVEKWIREGPHNAEYAVSRATRTVLKRFLSSKSFISHRGSDIRDMEHRLLRNLLGSQKQQLADLESEVVIIARDLTPSVTASLDRNRVRGIAIDLGGKTSHTAIIARALRIPAVVGLQDVTVDVSGGDMVIVDGTGGKIIIDPTASTREGYREREKNYIEFEQRIEFEQKDLPAETLDGHKIGLRANIELVEEVETAAMYGAEGIGLYRTEFLFLDGVEPDERTQIDAYRKAVQALGGGDVTIRTLDLGADKLTPDGMHSREKNPFLGCRSIRLCFEHMDLFKTQLRAILQAAVHGPIRIMFPMISAVEEVRQAKLI
ncbi:MAG: phosphoenolpyruvate--protein phosphotransferase, partial [Planctomycetota bacterium]|nr:phosphoenolpyruvate--protein phosphotransferase [Planctomycetota bacterium]